MPVLSYIFLCGTILFFWSQCLAVLKVALNKRGKSGQANFFVGLIMLCMTIYCATHYGW